MKFEFWKKKKPAEVDYRRPVDIEIEAIKKRLIVMSGNEQKEIAAAILKFAFPSHHLHQNPSKRKEA